MFVVALSPCVVNFTVTNGNVVVDGLVEIGRDGSFRDVIHGDLINNSMGSICQQTQPYDKVIQQFALELLPIAP